MSAFLPSIFWSIKNFDTSYKQLSWFICNVSWRFIYIQYSYIKTDENYVKEAS